MRMAGIGGPDLWLIDLYPCVAPQFLNMLVVSILQRGAMGMFQNWEYSSCVTMQSQYFHCFDRPLASSAG